MTYKPQTKRVQINMDQQLAADADAIFKQLGLTQTTAVTLFYKQVVRTHGIPFDITLNDDSNRSN